MKRPTCYLLTILLGLIVFVSFGQPAYADVNLDQLQGVINGLVSPQQVNESNKPFLADRNQMSEIIDPATGSLTLKQSDITLPGKDGLDLSIARIYNSSQAEVGTKRVNVTSSSSSWTETVETYSVDVMAYNFPTGKYWINTVGPYSTFEQAVSVAESYLDDTADPDNLYISYTIYFDVTTWYYTEYTITTQNYADPYNYLRSRYDLGAGWSLAFPSVQIENQSGTKTLFFHDGTGAVYRIRTTTEPSDSNLENYQGKDVQFLEDNGSYTNGQVSSKYVFIGSDQRKTYFAADGRLIGIKDCLGNEIKFTHINRLINDVNYPYISQIVDSIGRTIDFTYENTINTGSSEQENIYITVYDPSRTKNISITYNKQRLDVTNQSTGQTWYDARLYSVTDPQELSTYYNYAFPTLKFMLETKNLSSSTATTQLVWLNDVLYTNSKSSYQYDGPVTRNLGPDGAYQGYRVQARYDQEWCAVPDTNQVNETGDINHIDYQYTGDHTGYPTYSKEDALPESYTFSSEATVADTGLKTKTVFNGKKQQTRVELTASNAEKKIISNLSFDSVFKFKPTRTEIADYASDGASNKLYVDRTYNEWGGLSSETKPLTWDELNTPSIKALYTMTYQYDPAYKTVTQKQWYQNPSTLLTENFTYNDLGRVETATNANGETTAYGYSKTAEGELVTITKNLEEGRLAKSVKVYGPEAKYAYPTIIRDYYTDANGNSKETITTRIYDLLLGLMKTETDNDENTTTYTYDNLARVTSIRLPNYTDNDSRTFEVEQVFEYYEQQYPNYMFSETDETNENLLTTLVHSYTRYTDVSTTESNVWDQRINYYDGFGNVRLQALWDFDIEQWVVQGQYHYDGLTRPNYFADAEGNNVTYAYNAWGELYKTVDPHGNVYQTDVELVPRKSTRYFMANSTTDKQNIVETYLDQWGRVIQKKAFPSWPSTTDAISESYTYDNDNNILTHTNPNSDTTTQAYDRLDRLSKVTDPLNQVTEYAYTVLDELKSIKQTDGVNTWTTIREYDELGRLTRKIVPSAEAEGFTPNALGLLERRTDLNQTAFDYTYDSHRREMKKQAGAGASFEYTYDNPMGVWRIDQFSNSQLVGRQGLYYNPLGQAKQAILITEETGDYLWHETFFSYDKAGKLTKIQDPFAFYINYGYDKTRLNRVQTDGSATSNTADEANARYEYYPNETLKSVTYPKLQDGTYLKAAYEYDDLRRLKKLTNTKGTQVLSEYQYSYDPNGNITGITDASGTTTYVYDKLNRLIEVHRPNDGNIIEYTYDVRGNRSTVKAAQSDVPNLEPVQYAYNAWDQLTEATTTAGQTSFQYGPTGLRTKKVSSTGTTRYHYNNDGEVIAESDASNAVTSHYVWGHDRVLVKKDAGGSEYYYLYNGHGDVVQLVDRSGSVVNTYNYDEWGNILNQTETVANPFKYTGEIYDSETGLYYLRARYYDPKVGRFISKDSYEGDIANPLSLNLYTYGYNNPLSYIDPSGNIGIRQWDSLGVGLLASVGETLMDIISAPGSFVDLVGALSTGKLPLTDLAKAIGASAIKPVKYLMDHHKSVWKGKPSDAEVYTYGKHLGTVVQMALGTGGTALKIISKALPRVAKLFRAVDGVGAAGKVVDKPLYRYMSKGELKAVQNTGYLRGGKTGPTYWTDSSFKNAENAAERLSLPNVPQYRVEFKLTNSPIIQGGTRVKPDYFRTGGGREYWSNDPVQVQIINAQPIGVR